MSGSAAQRGSVVSGGPILFFDGECGFCNGAVRWFLRHDRRGVLRFAPLQGETYAALEVPEKPRDMSTMVLLKDGRLYTRSSASARLLMALGGWWAVIGALMWVVPKPLRDLGYRLVARHRYRIAGRRPGGEACAIPGPDSASRMLP